MNGLAVAVKKRGSGKANLTRVISVTIGRNHPKRGFTLTPGVKTNWRRTIVNGSTIGDVPAKYTVTGLEPYELPVIGWCIDWFIPLAEVNPVTKLSYQINERSKMIVWTDNESCERISCVSRLFDNNSTDDIYFYRNLCRSQNSSWI